MASLNLLQWREQSLWRRYRTLHCIGIVFVVMISFFSSQWVIAYNQYLNQLQQQVNDQEIALKKLNNQQQRWQVYQQQQQAQRAFKQRRHIHQFRLNAFNALLHNTYLSFHQRELSLNHSQFKFSANYRQIQDVDDQYLWLEAQLVQPGLKQQLLPQQRVLFHYKYDQSKANHRG